MSKRANCECCGNHFYDDESGYYECQINLDEDEMGRFLTDSFRDCPYFQYDDEYRIVRRQM
ncbi:DUF6472 family protein [Diplocloster agilis]|uniref:DUF6472 domain-containing protein n=1 Tax=Diplocloster agilis TaxID=2850323 RepID=A0A949K3A7_9FIRM|nr:DUF6472 family protein [Diplocloster agilis]MBU9739301.1 hypothetical protein [Diplocloster agilis]